MKTIKTIFNWLELLITGKGPIADEAIREGIVSYEGQGRNKFGV